MKVGALFKARRPKERTKEMNARTEPTAIRHEVMRLDIPTHETYDDFLRRFESVVPSFATDRAAALIERRAPWSEVIADVAASAPHDFLLYWKLDLTPLMSLAGNQKRATEYLMGNHVIAETMYRHDAAAALYVPLRCAIFELNGEARFAIDQPSTVLSSLGRNEITQVGRDLDRKLARLFDVLHLEAPAALEARI
jgi:hypothetical protein